MANEKNDISEIVKKCKILLLDIEGTTTSISFVKDKLFPYAEENVKDFLNNEWESEEVKKSVTALRKQALEDEEKKVDGIVVIPGEDASKDDQIEGLVKNVKWQMSLDRKVAPLKQLQGLIWKKGYDKGDIKGHVYEDVSPALELWRSVEGQKVYIYSSGSVQAQKLLFSMSSAGDMLKLIDGHFDTAVGGKQEPASYTAIAEKVDCKPEEILFLTDIDKEAEAACSAGVQPALVSREGNAPLSEATTAAYPVIYSFAELAVTNKRKPDTQDEQPAKVLKTDVETSVKTAPEPEVNDVPAEPVTTQPSEKGNEPEKMEVEEEVPAKQDEPIENNTEKVVEKVVTIVEEVTDSNDVADLPVCDVEPVIEESPEKTEIKETEQMETEPVQNSVSALKENAELKNGDKSPESPVAVITEIKDITNEKENHGEVTDIIENLVPVVEEPPAQDMEELQNVGEVLEKECDEILSKVQDVTNLDNIPVKPLLNPIAEETMETDNVDSNDIVDRILDTELELEMKQCENIDVNNVQDISKEKEAAAEDKSETQKIEETPTAVPEDKSTEKNVEETEVVAAKVDESSMVVEKVNEISSSEQKSQESSPTEVKAEEDKAPVEEEKTKPQEEKVENNMETEVSASANDDSKVEVKENNDESKLDTEEKKVEPVKSEDESTEISVEKPPEESSMETEQTDTPIEITGVKIASDSAAEETKPENDKKETQVNGKTSNGDTDMVTLNGKGDELSSRLSIENGKETVVNGANGDSSDGEKVKSENNGEEMKEVADIKVKTVAIDEPRNDPIEQPTEA